MDCCSAAANVQKVQLSLLNRWVSKATAVSPPVCLHFQIRIRVFCSAEDAKCRKVSWKNGRAATLRTSRCFLESKHFSKSRCQSGQKFPAASEGPAGPPAQKVNATWRDCKHPLRDAGTATWTGRSARVAPRHPAGCRAGRHAAKPGD